MISFTFEAIGTKWSIDINDQISEHDKNLLLETIRNRIEVYDKTYSRFRSDSLITKMSRRAGAYELPEDAEPLLALYRSLYQITDGTVTPLIGNVLNDAGYDAEYSLKPRKLRKPDAWDKVIEYAHPKLHLKKPVLLDFGAAGKGYLIDIIGELLKKDGLKNYCIDGSGDILYVNKEQSPIRIGLEHPENPKQVIGVAEIMSGSICSSAGNRRKWDKFHHIMNPHTLTSPKEILSVWVTAETAMIADGLATCLFFTEPDKLKKYFTFEYVILKSDYTIQKSKAFPGEFFYK